MCSAEEPAEVLRELLIELLAELVAEADRGSNVLAGLLLHSPLSYRFISSKPAIRGLERLPIEVDLGDAREPDVWEGVKHYPVWVSE